MKRSKYGIHGPNHDPTNIEAMIKVGCSCYTVLAKYEQVGMIRKAQPNALILLRPYWGPTNLDEDPVQVAGWCDNIVDPLWKHTHHVTAMNEANIEWGGFGPHPGRVEGWKHLNEWMLRWTDEFLKRRPDAIIHWPALSPGWGDDPAVMDPPGMWYCRESIEVCPLVDIHCYWGEGQHRSRFYGRRYEMVHELFPNKYLFVSECAPNDYRRPGAAQEVVQWFGDLYGYECVHGGTAFNWMWNWERQYHIIQNKPLVVGAMTLAHKPLIEVPTNWRFEEEKEEMDDPITILMPDGSLKKMEIEEYLKGVIHEEAIDAWGNEAGGMEILKAQAIAARGYAAWRIKHPKHDVAAVCTTSCCQNYSEFRYANSSRAVDETRGIVVTRDGQPIETEYHSCCGGTIPDCPCAESGHDELHGHGRGMCQWGGFALAVYHNRTWRQILELYYPQGDWGDGPSEDWVPYAMRGTVTITLAGHDLGLPVKGQVELQEEHRGNQIPPR